MTIEYFFTKSFTGDYLLLYILSFGGVFLAIRKVFALTLGHYKKVLWLSSSAYIPAVLNLGLNFLLIPIYGIYGAAVATMLSFMLYAFVVFKMSQNLYAININYVKIIVLFIIALVMIFIVDNNFYVNILLLAIYILIGYIYKIHILVNKL